MVGFTSAFSDTTHESYWMYINVYYIIKCYKYVQIISHVAKYQLPHEQFRFCLVSSHLYVATHMVNIQLLVYKCITMMIKPLLTILYEPL